MAGLPTTAECFRSTRGSVLAARGSLSRTTVGIYARTFKICMACSYSSAYAWVDEEALDVLDWLRPIETLKIWKAGGRNKRYRGKRFFFFIIRKRCE